MISAKSWVLMFLLIVFTLGPGPIFSYAEDISKSKCGSHCHSNKENLYSKKNSAEECTQCHSTGNTRIRLVAMDSKNKPSVAKKTNEKKYDDLVLIPKGEFIMGSNERWVDESPEFINRISAYLIDRYEVTNSNYKEFVDATNYPPSLFWEGKKIPEGFENNPVTYVNWSDASAYCKWKGKRLPTEAEWEKAARGKLGLTFPWGDEFDPTKSNSPQSGSKGTKPVGSYELGKSPYGLYDMVGNVWEWTSDWYMPHPGNNIPNSQYGKINRLIKGGSWFDCMAYACGISAPTYNRGAVVPTTKNNTIGFRCAKSL